MVALGAASCTSACISGPEDEDAWASQKPAQPVKSSKSQPSAADGRLACKFQALAREGTFAMSGSSRACIKEMHQKLERYGCSFTSGYLCQICGRTWTMADATMKFGIGTAFELLCENGKYVITDELDPTTKGGNLCRECIDTYHVKRQHVWDKVRRKSMRDESRHWSEPRLPDNTQPSVSECCRCAAHKGHLQVTFYQDRFRRRLPRPKVGGGSSA